MSTGSDVRPLGYSECMSAAAIPSDTSAHARSLMVERFAAMSTTERARVAEELNEMCTTLAIAGIRSQHGDLSDHDLRWHLAFRRYGKALADDAYGARTDE